MPEIKLAPRQIFTRSEVRADVERILELYRRQGRFAARVEPKIVQLDQNRVDVVFEIYEGDLAKVREINIIGNKPLFATAGCARKCTPARRAALLGFLKSNDTYDPDRLAADQQKLRAFYLTEGYADFRVVSALAELTPDRRDFVITYVVEEGPRYKFGTVEADSALRDLPNAQGQGARQAPARRLVQRQGGRGCGHRPQRGCRQPRLRLRRHQPGLRSRCRKAADEHHLPGRRDPARLCRADRHHRQHGHPRQGHPARVPAQRRRRIQRDQGQAQPGSHPEPRLLPGKARDQADRRLGARPGRARRQRRGKIDRPAVAVGRLFEPRAFRLQLAVAQNNFMGKGQALDASGQLFALLASRSSWASSTPISSTSRSCSAASFSAATIAASTISATSGTRPIRRSAPAAPCGSASRSPNSGASAARYTLVADKITLDKSTFYTDPDGTGPLAAGLRPAQGGPLSVRRNRQPGHVAARLFDDLRRYRRHSPDPRPAAHLVRRISPGLAATFAMFAPASTATKYRESRRRLGLLRPRRGRLHPAAAEIARTGPRRDPPDRSLLRSAAARLRYPRHRPAIQRVPYKTDGTLDSRTQAGHRRAWRPRLLHGPARARIPDSVRRSRAWAAAVGIPRRRLAVVVIKQPI